MHIKNRKAAFKGGHSKIHLNLSIALLCGLIVFVSGIESAKDNEVSIVYLRMYVLIIYSLLLLLPSVDLITVFIDYLISLWHPLTCVSHISMHVKCLMYIHCM